MVTKPFGFEGRRRMQQALQAIENLRAVVDTLIIVSNDRSVEVFRWAITCSFFILFFPFLPFLSTFALYLCSSTFALYHFLPLLIVHSILHLRVLLYLTFYLTLLFCIHLLILDDNIAMMGIIVIIVLVFTFTDITNIVEL